MQLRDCVLWLEFHKQPLCSSHTPARGSFTLQQSCSNSSVALPLPSLSQPLICLCLIFSPDSYQFTQANGNLKWQVTYFYLKIFPVGKANALLLDFKDTKERTAFLAGFCKCFPHQILIWAETRQSFKGQNLKLKPTFNPCQGRLPRRKYINIWPRASKSSRRLCSRTEEMANYCCSCRNGSEIWSVATPISEIKLSQGSSLAVCSSDLVQKYLEPVTKTHKIPKEKSS